MTRTTWILPVAVVLATALAQPVAAAEPAPAPAGAPAEPEPGATEPRYATVEIDTSDIGEEGPVIKRRSRERTDVVLRAAGVLPGRPDAGDPVIRIDVDELTGPDPGYLCEVWIDHRGEVLGERRRVECTLCTESEIVQRVEATVTELVAQLPVDDPTQGSDPAPPPASSAASEPASPSADRRAPMGTLGKAGAALVAVGVAGVGVGAVLVAMPPVVDQDDPLYETTYRPPGAIVLGTGAAVLAAGVAMLVVDRRRARSRRTALVPTAGPTGAGLQWSGRF